MPVLPEVPTEAEAGYPGYGVEFWQGLFVPAGTPANAIARSNAAAVSAASDPSLVSDMAGRGITIAASSPAELDTLPRRETLDWAELVRAMGITAE